MAGIHVLSQDTVNKIAAGEVIERPMAVVKELIENAIDAGAGAVTVEVEDGGKRLIRITDNGCGIAPEEIPLAFTPHATSKIQDAEDLLTVSSLGFRGEALASIASVSQLEMLTKTRESLVGTRYVCEGGGEGESQAVGCPEGTTVLVRNLFYNTPARLKFLKTSQTEAGYISGLVERMALARPDISFRFIHQKQTKLSTSGNGNLRDVVYHIYGRDIASNLVEIKREEGICQISGFIGKPVISRGNRGMMNYFINGRYIKSPVIWRAIEQAYAPYTMQHRYPFTVLHLAIAPGVLDVNVHPQKMEVRFNREQEIFQSVFEGVSQALAHREFIPEVTFQERPRERREKREISSVRRAEPFEEKRRGRENLQALEALSSIPAGGAARSAKAEGEIPPSQSTESPEQDGKNPLHSEAAPAGGDALMRESSSYGAPKKNQEVVQTAEEREVVRTAERQGIVRPAEEQGGVRTAEKQEQLDLFGEGILSGRAQKEVKIIGQVFSTYWILQYEDKMYLVDQHAAHEKVLYERFMAELREREASTQLLHPPIVLTLSMNQQQAVEEHREVLERLGYQMEVFGGREYAVSGVPSHLPEVGSREMLLEVIDSLVEESGRRKSPEILLEKVASMSCKAAVKGNNALPAAQMEELLRELMDLDNPYHCPHGRPTMISMSKRELEKKFKRIL